MDYHWPKYGSEKKIEIKFATEQPPITWDQSQFSNEYEKAELQKILDDNTVIHPLETFGPLQPANKPKYPKNKSSFDKPGGLGVPS